MLSPTALLIYGLFLAVMLGVNLLYFFQVFKYRLPGDASAPILTLHLLFVAGVLVVSGVYLGFR